jgi:hypothetical protein
VDQRRQLAAGGEVDIDARLQEPALTTPMSIFTVPASMS